MIQCVDKSWAALISKTLTKKAYWKFANRNKNDNENLMHKLND